MATFNENLVNGQQVTNTNVIYINTNEDFRNLLLSEPVVENNEEKESWSKITFKYPYFIDGKDLNLSYGKFEQFVKENYLPKDIIKRYSLDWKFMWENFTEGAESEWFTEYYLCWKVGGILSL